MSSQPLFYVYVIVAIIVAALVFKRVVTCVLRLVVILVLLVALAFGYYYLVGQYDPELREAVEKAEQQYEGAPKIHKM